ncbi:MAG: triose-phosphate isomerase [Lentisphaerae bacterium RIFOXYA12_FULL_48_11]|nr:MAG: triose-phosphate isomerase [Lentisphaerae bacterium RIFOXYA12_FULL_48_11]
MAKKLRKKIIAGNWKMNKSVSEAADLASDIKSDLADYRDADIVLCPPFTALKTVSDVITQTHIKLGAQNMHWASDGAYTGEISPSMLRDVFCHYVILGHSERRTMFNETDEIVNKKVKAAIAGNLCPIVCVGEVLQERESGAANDVVKKQVAGSLAGLGDDIGKVVIAYEPVWAIGTGKVATPAQAQEMHAFIRGVLGSIFNEDIAQSIRIQYGGSMKPSNAGELLSQPDIDGGLIGGAALDARSFVEIVRLAK